MLSLLNQMSTLFCMRIRKNSIKNSFYKTCHLQALLLVAVPNAANLTRVLILSFIKLVF
jgi:hypothetical protein